MTIRTGLTGLCFCGLVVASGAQGRDLPRATDEHGGFALPDERGGRLLQIPDVARPERLKAAFCSGGRRVAVAFDRRQVERDHDGRQTGRNFDRLAGSVYRVLESSVGADAVCFLPSEALLAGRAILSMAAPAASGACLQRQRLAERRDRPVVHCWPLVGLAPDKQVALVEFERRGTNALASLVVVDGIRTIFADFPAEFRGAGQDLWRADDGGVLTPAGLEIIFALQRGGWYALGTAWQGAEGRVLSLWISEGSERFTKVIADYWYQAPI